MDKGLFLERRQYFRNKSGMPSGGIKKRYVEMEPIGVLAASNLG